MSILYTYTYKNNFDFKIAFYRFGTIYIWYSDINERNEEEIGNILIYPDRSRKENNNSTIVYFFSLLGVVTIFFFSDRGAILICFKHICIYNSFPHRLTQSLYYLIIDTKTINIVCKFYLSWQNHVSYGWFFSIQFLIS